MLTQLADDVAAGLAGWLHLTTGACRHVGDVDAWFIGVPATSMT